jgi:hypothetical protein
MQKTSWEIQKSSTGFVLCVNEVSAVVTGVSFIFIADIQWKQLQKKKQGAFSVLLYCVRLVRRNQVM